MAVQSTHTLETLNVELDHFRNNLKTLHAKRLLNKMRIDEITFIIQQIKRDILEVEIQEQANADS